MNYRLVAAAVVLATCSACDDQARKSFPLPRPTEVSGAEPPLPPPVAFAPQRIELGTTEGHFTGTQLLYEFVSPGTATLVVKLDWQLRSSFLVLVIDKHGILDLYPPLSGRVPVAPQQIVNLAVNGGGTDDWYDDKFRLTLTLE